MTTMDTSSGAPSHSNGQGGAKCPFRGGRVGGAFGSRPTISDWWPNRLPVELLHQDPPQANPLGDVDYKKAFEALDLKAVKEDIRKVLTDSQPWWPADYGHYGPQMVRMAWHAAGTYRIADGRGGASAGLQRFAPTNSWDDNGNIDKSRRLLWPVKKKYGAALSWADLMILTGNVALEDMGFKTYGFGGGRIDAWEPDRGMYFGSEFWDGKGVNEFARAKDAHATQPGDHPGEMVTRTKRWTGKPGDENYDLEAPLAASFQGLIYVHPEGPLRDGDPQSAIADIRETFKRMAMNDEETVALIAGGHAFGKSHGAVPADKIGPAPEGAPISAMGMGWKNEEGSGYAKYAMTSGIEGAWTPEPTKWDNAYLENLFKYEWELTRSPAGGIQYKPKDDPSKPEAPKTPDAHEPGQQNELMMLTTDIALKVDPEYNKICQKFLADFDYFSDCFARAWFKLTHRDMGPKSRYMGPEVPAEDLIWQDPVPAVDHDLVTESDVANLKQAILSSGLSVGQLVSAAWASASTYRDSDKRGGANGARVALDPQKDWAVNRPEELAKTLDGLRKIQGEFNGSQSGNKKISLADLIVLGGCAAIEKAAKDAGVSATVPFTPGRTDCPAETMDEHTDVESFDWLQPVVDGFRNYVNTKVRIDVAPERIFLDRANLLTLTAPEWTVLVGGLRVLDQNFDHSKHGVFTDRPGVLSNDFFTTLTSMDYEWEPADPMEMGFYLKDRATGETKHTATRLDLVFGSNAQLRNLAEVYAADDGHERMVHDFIAAWNKVMMLDRFDVK
ncbi:hydroperoxidase [Leptolyngbya valderiana BDU 20041]|nr:hydroperoxidase [Leptolyngbya valderiana BDU 20041]